MQYLNKILNLIKHPLIFLKRIYFSKILNLKYLIYIKKGFCVVGEKYIHIGKCFGADIDVRIEAWNKRMDEHFEPYINIGDNVFCNSRTHITSINKIIIGDNVLIGSDVLISDNNHGKNDNIVELNIPPKKRRLHSKGSVIIEKNVWIGDKVIVLGNVRIGEGSVIGAGSIVTHDIPKYSIAVGQPARVIKNIKSEEK